MNRDFIEKIEASPIIAAVKDEEGLNACLKTDVGVVFILYGDVCSIPEITAKITDAGRTALVHLDLIAGLSQKEAAVDYIRKCTAAAGIITTKTNLIPYAKQQGLAVIQRVFVLDSMALDLIQKQSHLGAAAQPDILEILPGVLAPSKIRSIRHMSRIPLICGGLIKDREDVMNALNNGAIAVSTTSRDVWSL